MRTSTMSQYKLLLLILYLAELSATSTVVRQNVGTIFEPKPEPLLNGHTTSTMLLAIPYKIPEAPVTEVSLKDKMIQLTVPTLQDHTTGQLIQQAGEIDKLLDIADKEMNATLSNTRLFLANPINTNHRTIREALLGFLAPLFRGILGLATVEDVQQVMDQLTNIDSILNALAQQDKSAAILIDKITQRQDKFVKAYVQEKQTLEDTISAIGDSVNLWASNITRSLNRFSKHEQLQREKMQLIDDGLIILAARMNKLQALQRTNNALRMLSAGILTPDMISPTDLAAHLEDIDNHLKINYPGSKVAIKDLDYYYSQRLASYVYSTHHIYIHMEVIVQSTTSTFRVYQMTTLPMPINTQETPTIGLTQLKTDVQFIAVSRDNTEFIELTAAQMLSCTGNQVKICSKTTPRIHGHNPTCAVAIFLNMAQEAKVKCKFTVSPAALPPTHAIAISEDEYLVLTNSPSYFISCHGKSSETYPAQAYSVIGVPCGCTASVGTLALPNSRPVCNTTLSFHYLLPTINLPFLAALDQIHPTELDSTENLPNIPQINLTRTLSKLKETSPLDESTLLDLNPFAKTLLEDAENLDTTLESRHVESLLFKISKHPAAFLIPSIISAIATFLAIYALFKISKLAPAVAYLPAARAYRLMTDQPTHKILQITTTTQSNPTTTEEAHQPFLTIQETHTLIVALLLALIIYLSYRLAKYCKKLATAQCGISKTTKRTNPDINFKIYCGDTNYTFALRSIPHEFDEIISAAAPKYNELLVQSFPLPKVTISWDGPAVITTKKGSHNYQLPSVIHLRWKSRFRVLPALRTPGLTYALLLQNETGSNTVTMETLENKLENIIIDDQQTEENVDLITSFIRFMRRQPLPVMVETNA